MITAEIICKNLHKLLKINELTFCQFKYYEYLCIYKNTKSQKDMEISDLKEELASLLEDIKTKDARIEKALSEGNIEKAETLERLRSRNIKEYLEIKRIISDMEK